MGAPESGGASVRRAVSKYLANREEAEVARGKLNAIQQKILEAGDAERRAASTRVEVECLAEDLAAEVALGRTPLAEAEKRRAEIARAEKSNAASLSAVEAARRTKAGLDRLFEEEQAKIGELDRVSHGLVEAVLREEAALIAPAYAAQARKTLDLCLRLTAIHHILRGRGFHPIAQDGGGQERFCLPAFFVPEIGIEAAEWRMEFNAHAYPHPHQQRIADARERLMEQMRSLGVDL